jgi:hypothetical protein
MDEGEKSKGICWSNPVEQWQAFEGIGVSHGRVGKIR